MLLWLLEYQRLQRLRVLNFSQFFFFMRWKDKYLAFILINLHITLLHIFLCPIEEKSSIAI